MSVKVLASKTRPNASPLHCTLPLAALAWPASLPRHAHATGLSCLVLLDQTTRFAVQLETRGEHFRLFSAMRRLLCDAPWFVPPVCAFRGPFRYRHCCNRPRISVFSGWYIGSMLRCNSSPLTIHLHIPMRCSWELDGKALASTSPQCRLTPTHIEHSSGPLLTRILLGMKLPKLPEHHVHQRQTRVSVRDMRCEVVDLKIQSRRPLPHGQYLRKPPGTDQGTTRETARPEG